MLDLFLTDVTRLLAIGLLAIGYSARKLIFMTTIDYKMQENLLSRVKGLNSYIT